eukprot:Colp12_sorted_trinity150504_noHs@34279
MERDRHSTLVFYHPSMANVAHKVVERCHAVRDGQTHRHVDLSDAVEWGKFEDGFPNIFIRDVKEMAGRDVIFLASFHTPEVIFEQLSIIYTIPRYLARSFTIILPYFPTGTMEKVEKEGQVTTAKTMATLLSAMPLTARGPAQLIIYDIHALQERFYFGDNVIPRLESAIPLLIQRLSKLPDVKNIDIAFPDEGAHKRFHSSFKGFETIICTKVRAGPEGRIVTIKDGNPEGKHVVIVDDLVKTGGTLLECARALRSRGASDVSFFVTHAVFPQESWRKFLDHGFKFFWITDSLPVEAFSSTPPFELLSIAQPIADVLMDYDLRRFSYYG